MIQLSERIKQRREELFEILSGLIRIDSQSFGNTGESRQIADHIAGFLRELGYTPDVYSPLDIPGMTEHPDYWPAHRLENRFNVSAVIPGRDHSRRLMLAAHSDTVAVGDLKNWTVDPFGGKLEDGKLWGRGACDDKYGIATVLFLIKLFQSEGLQFPCDIVFTAYCNEEYGGSHGALAACLRYPCDDIINIDCKNFDIWCCAVGGGELKTHIRAITPSDDCSVMLEGLQVLKEAFGRFREARTAELRQHPEYAGTTIPEDAVRFMEMRAGNAGADLDRAYVEICYYASADRQQIDRELAQLAQQLDEKLQPLGLAFDRFEPSTRFFHFGKTDMDNPLLRRLIRAGAEATGRTLTPCGACQSDLSIFLKYGSPRAFSFGAGRDFNAYGGAHQADEYIECDRFLELTLIFARLLDGEL